MSTQPTPTPTPTPYDPGAAKGRGHVLFLVLLLSGLAVALMYDANLAHRRKLADAGLQRAPALAQDSSAGRAVAGWLANTRRTVRAWSCVAGDGELICAVVLEDRACGLNCASDGSRCTWAADCP
jgi:hypothetical protein